MWDIIRDSAFGQCLRIMSSRRIAKYPEEYATFELPAQYLEPCTHGNSSSSSTESYTNTGAAPEKNGDRAEVTVISWKSDNDPENSHNWSFDKKLWVAILFFVYTFSVHIRSSLYTSSEDDIREIFGVNDTVASLGLTLYVIAHGIGPMLFSPLLQIPAVGRMSPYIVTYFLFVIICVPMTLVNKLVGILVLRILLGFFGFPCLAMAGTSYGDFYGVSEMLYVIAMWAEGGATLGLGC